MGYPIFQIKFNNWKIIDITQKPHPLNCSVCKSLSQQQFRKFT